MIALPDSNERFTKEVFQEDHHTTIKILITGGTIDKDCRKGELALISTHVPQMLQQGRCTADVEFEVIMLEDSLDMDDSHRKKILNTCQFCKENKIVITHGTDTMDKTARVLEQNIESLKGKTIVLVGAMIPYTMKNSDALFNIGGAIIAVQTLPEGVFILMNGQLLHGREARKNKELEVFERVTETDDKA